MKQTKYIITSDWHLRGDKPRCRLDEDWEQTQKNIIDFIFDFAIEYKADIIHTGDLFEHSREPDWVKNMFLKSITRIYGKIKFYLLAGNHEMYYHNFDNIDRCSFGVIWNMIGSSDSIKSLDELGQAVHFNLPLEYGLNRVEKADKIFIHKLTYKNNIPPYIKNAVTAQELLDIFSDSKWIVTGDNHKRFIYENNKRYVINPGCIMRQDVKEINYEPSFYLIDFETEEIQTIKIPDDIEMVTDEYVIDEKERDERIKSFVELIGEEKGLSLSFRKVILNKLKKSNKEIDFFKDIIYECMKEVYGNNNR